MSLNPKDLAVIKGKIEDLEMRSNGLYKISCASATAKKVRVRGDVVTADVKLRNGEGEPIVVYEDVTYSLNSLLSNAA